MLESFAAPELSYPIDDPAQHARPLMILTCCGDLMVRRLREPWRKNNIVQRVRDQFPMALCWVANAGSAKEIDGNRTSPLSGQWIESICYGIKNSGPPGEPWRAARGSITWDCFARSSCMPSRRAFAFCHRLEACRSR